MYFTFCVVASFRAYLVVTLGQLEALLKVTSENLEDPLKGIPGKSIGR